VAAVRLAHDVGPREVARAAQDLGLSGPFGEDPSIALGAYEVTLMELTAAYAAVASGAAPVEPRGLPHVVGDEERGPLPETDALRDLLAAATTYGTARAARLRLPTYAKTGTTSENRDAWFVGWSGDLVAGVWVGNDDGTPMDGVSGGGMPARMWRDFMLEAVPGQGPAAPMYADYVPQSRPRGFWRRLFGGGDRGKGNGKGKKKKWR
jgi:penicillin-binding protein 1A